MHQSTDRNDANREEPAAAMQLHSTLCSDAEPTLDERSLQLTTMHTDTRIEHTSLQDSYASLSIELMASLASLVHVHPVRRSR